MSCHVYVDFDGTIVPGDATDRIFERFALPHWRDAEQEWQDGRIGSRECIVRQVSALRGSPADLQSALDDIQIDPAFPDFVAFCRDLDIGITVVSDGFDVVIAALLRRNGLDIPFYANHLTPVSDGRWRVTFPHARAACVSLSGHCKCSQTESSEPKLKVVVGDGRSDFCIAGRADLVLAKATLLRLCQNASTPCTPFENFSDVKAVLKEWLAEDPAKSPAAAAKARAAFTKNYVTGTGSQEAIFGS